MSYTIPPAQSAESLPGTVLFDSIPVGSGYPPVFLAEIGTFFNQDASKAKEMIERIVNAARSSTAVPVILKGEILHDPSICFDDDTLETYVAKDGTVKRERFRALVERKLVSLETYRDLFSIAAEAAVPFVVSVYDPAGADFAVEIGAAGLKIASANLTNIPLIRYVGSRGLPMIIDTGRATLSEVALAIQTARSTGADQLVVQHSPDGHPARPEAHNLRLLQTYAQAFEVPVGLSDHHADEEMLYVAVALGASLVEKGVAIGTDALEQDMAHALELDGLPRCLQRLGNAWKALGRSRRDPGIPICGPIGTSQRQGLVARRDLKPGDRVSFEIVGTAWPAKGIPAQHWGIVEGWEMTEPVARGAAIEWHHVRAVHPS